MKNDQNLFLGTLILPVCRHRHNSVATTKAKPVARPTRPKFPSTSPKDRRLVEAQRIQLILKIRWGLPKLYRFYRTQCSIFFWPRSVSE